VSASIRTEGAGVRFLFDRQRQVVTPALARIRRRGRESWGLRDLTVTIGPGESVALLGPSGSGKTSLLRLVAGVLTPDAGRAEVRGRVASLLSIEAGLLERLTGRDNAELLGVIAGRSRRAARSRLDLVRQVSGLGDSFDSPVSSYSQGMRARLGYAASDGPDTAILLLDEVHEAFDHEFRAVVERRVGELVAAGGIVVAAGHDHDLLARLCPRALLLDRGHVRADGGFEDVRRLYLGEGSPEP
jgi:ABC-type polysaccharide/polyol phosphate transport system ATPase subunit